MKRACHFSFSFLLVVFTTGCIVFSFSDCKTKKHVAVNPAPDTSRCKIDHRTPRQLIAGMRKSELKFDWYSAKLVCDASQDSSRVSFDVNVRMRRDSVIWLNVTLQGVGIKVARALITKDSVKFIQYGLTDEKCFEGDFVYLSYLLHTDVDYDMIQSLLVGNSATFYEEDEKLRSSVNTKDCNYTLSTIRKHKLKRVLEGQKPLAEPLQTISLDPETFKIMKILFIDPQQRTFTATYTNFEKQDSMLAPHKAVFFARGTTKTARLEVTYKKVTTGEAFTFPFNIPDDCTPIPLPPSPRQGEDNGNHQ